MEKEEEKPIEELKTTTMEELFDNSYMPRTELIEGFLYAGTYIFAGAPKVGKSFMASQLAYHVSTGIPLWGRKVKQGKVLYLALEDNNQRLQSRLYRMFGGETTGNLFLATESEKFEEDRFPEQLLAFLREEAGIKLVIIDTLQKVRGIENDYNYSRDYEMISKLKDLTDVNDLCIVIVHHTRKQDSGDKFDTISGTNGLFGSADGAFVMHKLKRAENEAMICTTGRDQLDSVITVKRNPETLCWEQKSVKQESVPDITEPFVEKICELVTKDNPRWQGTATELLEVLGLSNEISPKSVSVKLNVNMQKFLARKVIYSFKRTDKARIIIIDYWGRE